MNPSLEDQQMVMHFANFLSWQARPATESDPNPPRPWPPAVFAYALGLTHYCPPRGEM